ncbi:MAG: hypothetical protein PHV02_10980 [Rhodocyclaceae bacterium]|nr:hypothetical protein [Rhodocyclaceae bacterium]
MQTTFADTIINLSMTGQLIRLELGTAVPVSNSEGKQEVRLKATQTLVMPLEGFVRSFGMQEQLIKKLIADGVLKAQQQVPASDVISTAGIQ